MAVAGRPVAESWPERDFPLAGPAPVPAPRIGSEHPGLDALLRYLSGISIGYSGPQGSVQGGLGPILEATGVTRGMNQRDELNEALARQAAERNRADLGATAKSAPPKFLEEPPKRWRPGGGRWTEGELGPIRAPAEGPEAFPGIPERLPSVGGPVPEFLLPKAPGGARAAGMDLALEAEYSAAKQAAEANAKLLGLPARPGGAEANRLSLAAWKLARQKAWAARYRSDLEEVRKLVIAHPEIEPKLRGLINERMAALPERGKKRGR